MVDLYIRTVSHFTLRRRQVRQLLLTRERVICLLEDRYGFLRCNSLDGDAAYMFAGRISPVGRLLSGLLSWIAGSLDDSHDWRLVMLGPGEVGELADLTQNHQYRLGKQNW